MQRLLIMDGKPTEVIIVHECIRTALVETTTYSDRGRHWIATDLRVLELEGHTGEGILVEGRFRVISEEPDGTLVVETFTID